MTQRLNPCGVGDSFPIVGIVASAGGLESFKSFFASMPDQSGMAFVLVPHLDATHKSSMVELISRQTSMSVVEADEGMQVEANSVYVIPSNRTLTLSHGTLRLSELPNPIGSTTAIDTFLRSLASSCQERAIGIVFSGTGTHGTLGIREIERFGGMVMAQSPESAEFDQMPQSAIDTGLVDFVLSPASMPETLLRYANHPYLNHSNQDKVQPALGDKLLRTILEIILEQTKYDFRSYRSNMIMRRIERRMGIVEQENLEGYIELLRSQPTEVEALCNDFLIVVTNFFRDPDAFAFLENELLPQMVEAHPNDIPMRVWIPSCATGEEAYSIAMLFWEAFERAGKPPSLQVFASDISQRSIEVARRGIFPASIAVDVSQERLKRFFVTHDEVHYRVCPQIRDIIVFSTQNIISDATFSKLDFISCRNLMIYLEAETQQKLISMFHYALVEDGHLLLGPAETIGRATNLFQPVSKKWRIYQRMGPGTHRTGEVNSDSVTGLVRTQTSSRYAPTPRKGYRELAESALKEYTPAAVIINHRYEVVYISGDVVNYLEYPTGEPSKDLLAMARAGLRTRLRAACHKAMTQKIKVVDDENRVQRNGVYVKCTITAQPMLDSIGSDGLVLVVFQDQRSQPESSLGATEGRDSKSTSETNVDNASLLPMLEYELKSTREELQNTIEEMVSGNEELQSSNEELESSKEELQSLNEELSTVNCQLLDKLSELDKSYSEITNLMASAEIATLYLDRHLRIKRFTHPMVALFSLEPTDMGRDIRDFGTHIVDDSLIGDCRRVLDSQKVVEAEIHTHEGRCFLRRVSPFRTLELPADGVVVTFIDLTARRHAEAEQRERDACFRQIFEHAATGIAITTLDGVLVKCNPAYCKLVGYSEEELRSTHFLKLVHPEDRDRQADALRTLQSGIVQSFEIENRYLHKDGSIVAVRKFVSGLPDGFGKNIQFLALVTDVSVQQKTLDSLRQSEERIRTILKTASDAIITIDHQGRIDSVNHSTESIFGYAQAELVGKNVSVLMPPPFSEEHNGYIERFLATGEPHILGTGREVICRRKDGTTFPADLAVSQVNHLGLFTGFLRDISKQKEMQKHILEIAAEEQRRIGLELHDGTQQELTGLSLYASALQETLQKAAQVSLDPATGWQFESKDYERLKRTAELLSTRLAETNQHVRDLAHGILPVQIDAEGLRSALMELASSINSKGSIFCVFECVGVVTIPDNSTATHLYRIAQEAVNNSLRHARADQIWIRLTLQDNRIVMEVRDNGTGFDPDSPKGKGIGMGMRTMEYRANIIGGRIEFREIPNAGTLMRCEILKGGNV